VEKIRFVVLYVVVMRSSEVGNVEKCFERPCTVAGNLCECQGVAVMLKARLWRKMVKSRKLIVAAVLVEYRHAAKEPPIRHAEKERSV
jgi:hypothetical protein